MRIKMPAVRIAQGNYAALIYHWFVRVCPMEKSFQNNSPKAQIHPRLAELFRTRGPLIYSCFQLKRKSSTEDIYSAMLFRPNCNYFLLPFFLCTQENFLLTVDCLEIFSFLI